MIMAPPPTSSQPSVSPPECIIAFNNFKRRKFSRFPNYLHGSEDTHSAKKSKPANDFLTGEMALGSLMKLEHSPEGLQMLNML